ncbi:Galactose oxidase/kelch repeat superfamily protein [Salvia divinorum]
MVESRASKRGRKECSRGIGKATMEDEIWKDFPEDLFESVIARFPISTFFRFRPVCRRWNSLLSCQSFSQQCAQVKHAEPWFYGITFENGRDERAMFDPSLSKWHYPAEPAMPAKPILVPVASSGGLVCLVDIDHTCFYMCNPLTRSFRELPSKSMINAKHDWKLEAIGMITRNGGYKILWAGSMGDYQVFDSANNSWSSPGRMPESITLPLGLQFISSRAVAVEGTLYFMRSDPYGLLSYEVESGIWGECAIPNPPHLVIGEHSLAESGGRIMLVGLQTENRATCVCVWELQKMTMLWKEVDRMPNIWCLGFYGRDVDMVCMGNKSLLMLSLKSLETNWLFSYDLSSREWNKLPGRVQQHSRTGKTLWIAQGTAFHPCLAAIP